MSTSIILAAVVAIGLLVWWIWRPSGVAASPVARWPYRLMGGVILAVGVVNVVTGAQSTFEALLFGAVAFGASLFSVIGSVCAVVLGYWGLIAHRKILLSPLARRLLLIESILATIAVALWWPCVDQTAALCGVFALMFSWWIFLPASALFAIIIFLNSKNIP